MGVRFEEASDDRLTFMFETDEGKDLVKDVRLGVLLGVFSSYWHLRPSSDLPPTSEARIFARRRGRDRLFFYGTDGRTGLLGRRFVIR